MVVPGKGDHTVVAEITADHVNSFENSQSNAAIMIMGGFSECLLKTHLLQYTYSVKLATMEDNMLNLIYCNTNSLYVASKYQHLG